MVEMFDHAYQNYMVSTLSLLCPFRSFTFENDICTCVKKTFYQLQSQIQVIVIGLVKQPKKKHGVDSVFVCFSRTMHTQQMS